MFKLGLTGSIGMGKSTTAQMFKDSGCAVWDADKAVHELYQVGGAAVPAIREFLPEVVVDGSVRRDLLRDAITQNPGVLKTIEEVVHPLVRSHREVFVKSLETDIGVFDIPLLFETGTEDEFDAVVTVFVDRELQKNRVLSRGTMNEQQFDLILARQMPIEKKLSMSDYSIETTTFEAARQRVAEVVEDIRSGHQNA